MSSANAPVMISDYSTNFSDVLLSLMVVVALIFLVVWLLKKMSYTSFSKSKHISIITEIPLSSKDRLMIIQAGDEQFLIGASPGYIGKIARLKKPVVCEKEKSVPSEAFEQFLSKAIKRAKSTDEYS